MTQEDAPHDATERIALIDVLQAQAGDLGEIKDELAQVLARLEGLAAARKLRPSSQAPPALAALGQRLDAQTHNLESVGMQLADYVKSGRERRRQNRHLALAAGLGALCGLALLLLAARFLPAGLETRLAALVVGENRWVAGMRLMAAESPEDWRKLTSSWRLANANAEALGRCLQEAMASGQPQACTITVTAPDQDQEEKAGP